MRLKALRLAHVGIFRDPVAIEGFSGALDVLAGPNEIGKSTLLRAIEAVFLRKHTAAGRFLDELRPYGGGEPRIEADFEAQGRRWRIAKQFGRGKSVDLLDAATGKSIARSAEAEAKVAALLGILDGDATPLGLVWLAQGQAVRPAALDAGGHNLLLAAIKGEIESAAGGSASRDVRERVAQALKPLTGGRGGQPQTGSAFDFALKRRDEARRAHEAAQLTAAAAEARLDALGSLHARLRDLADPARLADLEAASREAEQRLRAGEAAAGRLQTATAQLEARELAHASAVQARRDLEAALAELDRLERAHAATAAERQRLAPEAAAAQRALAEADAVLAATQAEARHLQQQTLLRLRAEQAAADARRLAETARSLADARAAAAAVTAAERMLKTSKVGASLLAAVEREQAAVDRLAERLAAAAPLARFDILQPSRKRVRLAGLPLGDRTEIRIAGPVEIEIEGIGRITLSPGGGSDRAEDEADLAAHRETLAAMLAKAGAGSVAAVTALDAERRECEQRLSEGGIRLSSLAPDGLAALEAEHAALQRRVSAGPPTPADPIADAAAGEHRAAELQARIETAAAARDAGRQRLDTLNSGLARASAQAAAAEVRIAELQARLPPAGARPAALEKLREAERQAQSSLNAASRDRTAELEVAPAADAIGRLATALRSAKVAIERNDAERHRIEKDVQRLEGELAQIAETDTASTAAALAGERERLEADVSRFERERAALLLLAEMLDETKRETQDRFLAPVLQRLAPYLAQVFPDARLVVDEQLVPTRLWRGSTEEQLDRLSGGTQEQVAVLARLGYARLLADTGRPLPLILDDALVSTDDDRLARMFEALAAAACVHQVIVLTCHARAFEPLVTRHGAAALSVSPWRP